MKDINGFDLKKGDKVKLINLRLSVWRNAICEIIDDSRYKSIRIRNIKTGEEGNISDTEKYVKLIIEIPDDNSQFEYGFENEEYNYTEDKFEKGDKVKIPTIKTIIPGKIGYTLKELKNQLPNLFNLPYWTIYDIDRDFKNFVRFKEFRGVGINPLFHIDDLELFQEDDDSQFEDDFEVQENKINEATLTKEEIREKDIYFNAAQAGSVLREYLSIFPANKIFNARYYCEINYRVAEPTDKHPNGVILFGNELKTQLGRITNNLVRKELSEVLESGNYKMINLFQDKFDKMGFQVKVVGDSMVLIRKKKTLQIIILKSDNNYYIIVSDTKKDLNGIAKYRQVRSEDWEKLVALAWNFNKDEYDKFMKTKRGKERYYMELGNRTSVSEGESRKFDPYNDKLNELYVKVADNISNQLKLKVKEINEEYVKYTMIYNSSTHREPLTVEWRKYEVNSKIPKTDIFLRENIFEEPVMRISMKKKGGSQLISSSKNDIKALFNTVYKRLSDEEKTKMSVNIDKLFDEEKWAKYTAKENILKIKKDFYNINKDWDTLSDENKRLRISQITDTETQKVMNSVLDHKELEIILGDYINSKKFKQAIVKEALTGQYKFGSKSKSCANWLLTFGIGETDRIEFYPITDALSEEIAENVEFNISFKSSGKHKMTVLRMTHEKYEPLTAGDYGINQMLLEAFDEKTFLNEEFLDIFKSGYDKFIMWILNFYEKIKEVAKNIIRNSIDEFLRIFGLESEIEIKKDYTF